MNIKATPTEIEITAIVGELVHDGFMDLDTDDIILLEQHDHASYKAISDKFVLWALALILRRMHERAEADGEAAAALEAAARMAGRATLYDYDDDCTTTTEDV